MIEREMQELLWRHPQELLGEPLKQLEWEASSGVGRADLVFEDRFGRLLVVEVKRGKLQRGAIDQLHDYFGMMKQRFPDRPVELMVVAHEIPRERRLACERLDIEHREISEKRFRDLAEQVGYVFTSEATAQKEPQPAKLTTHTTSSIPPSTFKQAEPSWKFAADRASGSDKQDFLSRCDEQGQEFFLQLLEAQRTFHNLSKVTWDHESGFSLHFYFHRIGFVPVLWGFAASNRDGKPTRQRVDFPFDFTFRRGVPEEFINDFAAALAAVAPLLGGRKRPSISISGLTAPEIHKIVQTVFSFTDKASHP